VRGLTGEELLRLPVRVRGIRVGRVVDVLIHPTDSRALGADVLCGDDRHRFLPFPAARLGSRELEVTSPLVLLDLQDDSSYRLEARSLSELRGTPVAGGSSLQDVVLGPDWEIVEIVLNGSEGPRRVPLDGIVLPPRHERRRLPRPQRRRRRPRRPSR
jgi:PRC-barrel domain protein